MGSSTTRLTGSCHCGNIGLAFETSRAPRDLPTRACACSFRRRHQARGVTDPGGRVEIIARDASQVSLYRFALGTADFVICARCGVYVGAVFTEGDKSWAVLNVNALDERDSFPAAVPVSYEGETAEARRARRRAKWTPALLRLG